MFHPFHHCLLVAGRQVSVALGHRDGFVPENCLEYVEVAARHHPLAGERMAQIMEVQVGKASAP